MAQVLELKAPRIRRAKYEKNGTAGLAVEEGQTPTRLESADYNLGQRRSAFPIVHEKDQRTATQP